jgi:hypothetical protein
LNTENEKKEYEKKANECYEQLFEHAKSIVADIQSDQGHHQSPLTENRTPENCLPTVSLTVSFFVFLVLLTV